jgi:hypothetical protein
MKWDDGTNYYIRTWACPCCGRTWTRRKSERHPYWSSSCSVCPRKLLKARTWKTRKNCVHERDAAKVAKAVTRMEGRPRTRGGRVLNPPTTVKRLWREVRRARTRPAVARRGAKFLAALLAYSRAEAPSDLRIYELRGGRATSKPVIGGGITSPPRVRLDDKMSARLWGEYRRALLQGRYEIALNPDAPSCDHLRATLIHEIQHVLDDDLRMKRYHDVMWEKRLAALAKMFPPEALP